MRDLGQTVRSDPRVPIGSKNSILFFLDAESYHRTSALQNHTSFVPPYRTEKATVRPQMNYRLTPIYLTTLRSSTLIQHVALVNGSQ